MELLFAAWLMGGAACLSLALLHLIIWSRGRRGVEHPLLSLSAFAAAALAFDEAWMSRVTEVPDYVLALKWSNVFIAAITVSMAWFVVAYGGTTRRWLAWLATAGWVAALAINAFAPYGVPFAVITEIDSVTWAWGETTSVPQGITTPWKWVADVSTLAIVLLVLDSMIASARRGDRRRSALFGAIFAFLFLGVAHATLVDYGIIASPYLISYLFLGVVLVAGFELAGEVVRASRLSLEVRANERRWRALMVHMDMLVVGVDRRERINYVNPYFSTVSGRDAAEVLGSPFTDLLPDAARDAMSFEEALSDSPGPTRELPLLARDGTRRILWSTLPLRDVSDVPSGALAIGVDVTEQRRAEKERDVAMRRLEALTERLEEENLYLKEEVLSEGDHPGMVGDSAALKYVLHRVGQVAETDATVLIFGETGVGKELVARAVHDSSGRADKPYIRVNCCVLPAGLAESELFGHEKGAFTGADRRRKGRFELAHTGTLFLDEVADLSPELQAKLLRVLQEGEMERLGSSETFRVDVRLIAATNKNLVAEIEAGRFRADLYYRLNVYPITVPPLRNRREDIPLLVQHFTSQMAASIGKSVLEVPGSVMRELQQYDWRGNIRELRNILERAVITSSGGVLRLPAPLGSGRTPVQAADPALVCRTLEEVERAHILEVLRLTRGQVAGKGGAAEILGAAPSTLRYRMKKLGIDPGPSGGSRSVDAEDRRQYSRRGGQSPRD